MQRSMSAHTIREVVLPKSRIAIVASKLVAGLLAIIQLAATARTADAQDTLHLPLRRDDRLRVWEPSRTPGLDTMLVARTGRLQGFASDTLLLRRFGNADLLRIPFKRAARVELSRGGTSRGAGALKGAGIGGLVLLGLGVLAVRSSNEGLGVALLAFYGTPVLVGGGAVLGAVTASGERWEPVPWPPAPSR